METIIWVGLAIALFAGILSVTKKQVNVSDRILSGWLFLLAIDYGNIGFSFLSFDFTLIPSSFFLFNPAFYLYARSLTDKTFKLKWIQLLHLAPYVFFEIGIHYYNPSFNIDHFLLADEGLWLRLLFSIAFLLSLFSYNILSIVFVHRHRLNLKNEFSNITENLRLSWLLFIVICYTLFVLTASVLGLFGFIYNFFEVSLIYSYSATLVLTFVLGFYGIRQDEIYKKREGNNLDKIDERYSKSKLTGKRKQEIKNLLLNYFGEQKPYLNPDLNMALLSEKLGIPKHQITEALNILIGKNFFQFVNEYRVEEVKERLSDPENDKFSIEAVAYDCGFSSKSSFFSVFKHLTGQTPLQFKNRRN